MTIQRHRCYTVACDACRTSLEDRHEGYLPHFDTEDTAIASALEQGWRIDTDGNLYCQRCLDLARCLTDGHDYGPWIPCHCHGRIPDHALWGCGLFRTCQRDGCAITEDTDLAHLPTTDEPTSFGR